MPGEVQGDPIGGNDLLHLARTELGGARYSVRMSQVTLNRAHGVRSPVCVGAGDRIARIR